MGAYMISPAGRVVNWRKVNSAGGVPSSQANAVLHTYTVTRINEKWLQGIEPQCSRI